LIFLGILTLVIGGMCYAAYWTHFNAEVSGEKYVQIRQMLAEHSKLRPKFVSYMDDEKITMWEYGDIAKDYVELIKAQEKRLLNAKK